MPTIDELTWTLIPGTGYPDQEADLTVPGYYAQVGPESGDRWSWTIMLSDGSGNEAGGGVRDTEEAAEEAAAQWRPEIIRVPLTVLQEYFLNDLDASGSETYAEAVAAGLRIENRVLVIPPGAVRPLATAVGIRADIADEGEYEIGRRNSILGLARKLARAGVTRAAPL